MKYKTILSLIFSLTVSFTALASPSQSSDKVLFDDCRDIAVFMGINFKEDIIANIPPSPEDLTNMLRVGGFNLYQLAKCQELKKEDTLKMVNIVEKRIESGEYDHLLIKKGTIIKPLPQVSMSTCVDILIAVTQQMVEQSIPQPTEIETVKMMEATGYKSDTIMTCNKLQAENPEKITQMMMQRILGGLRL